MAETSCSGFLFKLGGGRSEGCNWKRRHFALHGAVLHYNDSEPEPGESFVKPNGIALIDDCAVAERQETAGSDGSLRWEFALTHPCGDTLVLAAETRAERTRWLEALTAQLRSTRAAKAESEAQRVQAETAAARAAEAAAREEAARVTEARRAAEAQAAAASEAEQLSLEAQSAEAEAEAARADAEAALRSEHEALDEARSELASAEQAHERSQAQLKQARAKLKLRKALLHWRYCTLRRSFLTLLSIVFRDRIAPPPDNGGGDGGGVLGAADAMPQSMSKPTPALVPEAEDAVSNGDGDGVEEIELAIE